MNRDQTATTTSALRFRFTQRENRTKKGAKKPKNSRNADTPIQPGLNLSTYQLAVSTTLLLHWMISCDTWTYAQNMVKAIRKFPRSCRRRGVSRASTVALRLAIQVMTMIMNAMPVMACVAKIGRAHV